jgi:hypothetical protein
VPATCVGTEYSLKHQMHRKWIATGIKRHTHHNCVAIQHSSWPKQYLRRNRTGPHAAHHRQERNEKVSGCCMVACPTCRRKFVAPPTLTRSRLSTRTRIGARIKSSIGKVDHLAEELVKKAETVGPTIPQRFSEICCLHRLLIGALVGEDGTASPRAHEFACILGACKRCKVVEKHMPGVYKINPRI